MRYFIIVLVICSIATVPASAHAFAVLKWAWDGVANTFGFDRGPVPKVLPKRHPAPWDTYTKRLPKHGYYPNFHLQAEGF